MEINLNADPEFRRMVAQEVRAALVASTHSDVQKAVDEGIRRALGKAEEKIPQLLEQKAEQKVKEQVAACRIAVTVERVVREEVLKKFGAEINSLATRVIDSYSVADMLKARLDKIRIHIEA